MTKQQRRKLYFKMYCDATAIVETETTGNFYVETCKVLDDIKPAGICAYLWRINLRYDIKTFPELWAQRPNGKDEDDYWFPNYDWKPRLKVIYNALKATYNN